MRFDASRLSRFGISPDNKGKGSICVLTRIEPHMFSFSFTNIYLQVFIIITTTTTTRHGEGMGTRNRAGIEPKQRETRCLGPRYMFLNFLLF